MSSANEEDDRTVIRSTGGSKPAESPEGARASPSADRERLHALPAGTYVGEFEITSLLGEGGFSLVYIAWDHSLHRKVAVKEYLPSSLAMRAAGTTVQVRSERQRATFDAGLRSFVNEARLLAQFDHPSLVKVYRFWEANGTAYMVMPLYAGTTLKDKLRQMGSPPDEEWLMQLLDPLTEALAILHGENCLHRDIAPDNVLLLEGTERPLLLDFGAARRVIGGMTQDLTVILKQGYAPVEQYAEVPEMKQGPWTDLYALAASVHFAIMGKIPPNSVGRLMNDSLVPLSTGAAGRYSDEFLQSIDCALRVRPEQRTPDVAQLRADLGLPPPGAATASSRTSLRTKLAARRQGWAGGLVALGMLVAAAVGGSAYFDDDSPASGSPVAAATSVADKPPPPPTTPRSFEMRDEFNKVMTAQAADFKVQAAALTPQLRIGRDRLGFTVTSARDGYVQVLVLGPAGSLLLLFPNAQSSDSRIKAGQTLRLPQPTWLLDTAEPSRAICSTSPVQ